MVLAQLLKSFPELSITGYPPEDLLLKPTFIDANLSCLQEIVDASEAITVVVGFVDAVDDIYNAAAIIHNQKLETATYCFLVSSLVSFL